MTIIYKRLQSSCDDEPPRRAHINPAPTVRAKLHNHALLPSDITLSHPSQSVVVTSHSSSQHQRYVEVPTLSTGATRARSKSSWRRTVTSSHRGHVAQHRADMDRSHVSRAATRSALSRAASNSTVRNGEWVVTYVAWLS